MEDKMNHKIPQIYRAWINQPSTLDPCHKHHGKYCIVNDTGDTSVDVYFTEGVLHSMRVPRLSVSRVNLSLIKGIT